MMPTQSFDFHLMMVNYKEKAAKAALTIHHTFYLDIFYFSDFKITGTTWRGNRYFIINAFAD